MTSDHYAHLLTAALTEPGALSFEALHESIDHQVEQSEPATREWIAAVRRVQEAGHLTREQADALVVELVFSWHGQLDEKAALLSSLGDEALAEGTRARKFGFYIEVRRPFLDLMRTLGDAERREKVAYPSWDEDDDQAPAPAPGARRKMGPRLYDEQYEAALEECADEWRRAVRGEGIMTVGDALAFAYIGAHDNMESKGDLQIAAIQRVRAEGVMDEDLAWLLLDRMADAMCYSALDGDAILHEIEERIDELDFDGSGPGEETPPGETEGASEVWKALDAARERRTALFKRRVLRAAGEEEMARVMKERPEEFRRRVEGAGKEWEVE